MLVWAWNGRYKEWAFVLGGVLDLGEVVVTLGIRLVCIEISQGPFCNFSKIEGLK